MVQPDGTNLQYNVA